MDTKSFIKNLNQVICEYSKVSGKKYSEVWLTPVDFGGLYDNGKFNLCVKSEHQIDSCLAETTEIINYLDKNANEELKIIWAVLVYDSNDEMHCVSETLKVFDESQAC